MDAHPPSGGTPQQPGRWRAAARWAPALIWMAVIFFLSHQPDLHLPGVGAIPDKAWHAGFYAVLGALLWRALRPSGLSGALLAIALGAAYGYTDEVHQRFVAGRFYDLGDWAFDIIGLVCGVLLALAVGRLGRRGR